MPQALIPITTKVEPGEKERFFETARQNGLSPAATLRMFVTAFNEYGTFPYDIRLVPNATTRAAIEAVERGETVGPFYSIEELKADLDADD
jgi:antitoxin component of RelBE/YafQ-DinJ toxin-antitoxin module